MRILSSRTDFERVYRQGRRYNHPLMRMVITKAYGEGDPGRVAFAAPKRIGKAHARNRAKRVLRETARVCAMPPDGADVILFATRATAQASPDDLSRALRSLLGRALPRA